VAKNITQPTDNSFQVRVVSRKKEHSRSFCFSHWGSKSKALQAAKNWRDQKKLGLAKVKRQITSPSVNNSTGHLGVSRAVKYDKRRDTTYLMYIVCWINAAGKKRAKTFSLGRSDVISTAFDNHALDVAKRCREAWKNTPITIRCTCLIPICSN